MPATQLSTAMFEFSQENERVTSIQPAEEILTVVCAYAPSSAKHLAFLESIGGVLKGLQL